MKGIITWKVFARWFLTKLCPYIWIHMVFKKQWVSWRGGDENCRCVCQRERERDAWWVPRCYFNLFLILLVVKDLDLRKIYKKGVKKTKKVFLNFKVIKTFLLLLLHEDAPTEEHPGSLTILLSYHFNSNSLSANKNLKQVSTWLYLWSIITRQNNKKKKK